MKIFVSLVVYLIMVSISSCSLKQINSSDEQAMEMLKGFYTSYITVFDKVPAGPESEMKVDSLQQKYCTNAFLKKINALEPLDSDPFLKAQDSNIDYLKTLSIVKDSTQKNTYIVSYIDDFIKPDRSVKEKVIIHLTVIKEKGKVKINSVW